MPLPERLELYRKIVELRGRPLLVYITSPRPNANASMAADAIPEFLDQLEVLPRETNKIDLLVVSNGGDATVAWRTMSLLRERVEHVSVLLPQAAFSAATLLALGANEIVMHPHGNLGPVDPQITVMRRKPGSQEMEQINFGSEDLAGFLDFVRNEVGLSDQEHVRVLFERFCSEVGAVPVGVATRGARLSMSLGEKLLTMHMKEGVDQQKVKAISEALNKGYFHHGYPVGRTEARQIGLKVADEARDLEGLMWEVWLDVEREMKCRTPFDPLAELASSAGSRLLFGPAKQLDIPANLPPPIMDQVLQAVLNNVPVVDVPAVDYTVLSAVMESSRKSSKFVVRGTIMAARRPDLQILVNVVQTQAGWVPA